MVRQYIFPWNEDVLARAAGQCFLDLPDYDELGKKLLIALQVGTATKDKRFLRVTADGNPGWCASSTCRWEMSREALLGYALSFLIFAQ
jgi:hypothetical protein